MPTVESIILALTDRQHGAVSRQQLLRAGVTSRQVATRRARGFLKVRLRGVYVVGSPLHPLAPAMAACLAYGRSAIVSGLTAAGMWSILKLRSGDPPMITVVGVTRSRPGVLIRRVRELPRSHVTRLSGMRVTTPLRTLLDLGPLLEPRELERAVAEACARGLATEVRLQRFLAANGNARGAPALRQVLAAGPAFTRSEAEDRVLAMLRSAEIAAPEVNVRLEGLEVDFLWRAERFVLEVDGMASHATRRGQENDRRRDAILVAAGYRVMRIGWHQIVDHAPATLVRIGQTLAQR